MAKKKFEVTHIEKRQRSFFGKIVAVVFYGFNIAMLVWLISYFASVDEQYSTAGSQAAQAGTVIGGAIGTGMLLSIWVAGAIVLGIIMLLTRGKKLVMAVSEEEKT